MVQVGRNKLYLKDYEALMNALDTNFHGTGRKPSEDFLRMERGGICRTPTDGKVAPAA
jgi:hypothetical protein